VGRRLHAAWSGDGARARALAFVVSGRLTFALSERL
jgi:hypothetical protein